MAAKGQATKSGGRIVRMTGAGKHGDRRTKRVKTRAAVQSRALRDWQ